MSTDKNTKTDTVGTTGHNWDGIEELNNPLPRWWLWTFYACIVVALVYSVLYPAWPLVRGATPGLLGFSTRANVAKDIQKFNTMNAPIEAKLVATNLADVAKDSELKTFAVNAGSAVFQTWCAQCHGSGAAGVQGKGFPNLLDDDWLWGGTLEDIHTTVTHGIRNEQDPDARLSQMPAFGEILEPDEIGQVVQYVRKLSEQDFDAALATPGETVFADNCAACHGDLGTGGREVGAPNLTDAIWLYGGNVKTLTYTVTNARYGVMPAWQRRLSEADIRAVSIYVHQLGGGE